MFELKKVYHLESSRRLTHLPEEHPCSRLHGHSFKVTLVLKGKLSEDHWVIDYADIDLAAEPVLLKLDHAYLNDMVEHPTTENLTKYIFEEIKPNLEPLVAVEVSETHDTSCRYPV